MNALSLFLLIGVCLFTNCKDDDDTVTVDKTDDVVEIAIRQVKSGQLASFEQARTNFINLLTKQQGVSNDREYASFYHFNPAQDTSRAVYIGMTQYENLETFQKVGAAIGGSTEAAAFFKTFDALVFTAMKPKIAGTVVDLSKVAVKGQILEVAVRNLAQYPNFNKTDYENKLSAFLSVLSKQKGRVAEYQWVSVLDPNIVIGMTVYESQQAFLDIASNSAFAGNQDVITFFSSYPPNMGGEVSTVVK